MANFLQEITLVRPYAQGFCFFGFPHQITFKLEGLPFPENGDNLEEMEFVPPLDPVELKWQYEELDYNGNPAYILPTGEELKEGVFGFIGVNIVRPINSAAPDFWVKWLKRLDGDVTQIDERKVIDYLLVRFGIGSLGGVYVELNCPFCSIARSVLRDFYMHEDFAVACELLTLTPEDIEDIELSDGLRAARESVGSMFLEGLAVPVSKS